jgi:hypothetical protein
MKRTSLNPILFFLIMVVASCDEPQTTVTNYVHSDGSVLRKLEMRNQKKNFKKSDLQVPFDSTWVVKDSCEVNTKGDTTYIKRAEKLFKNIKEINLAYKSDSGANRNVPRTTSFKKSFRWFYTVYRFSEIIDKKLEFGYPVRNFLNDEELLYFYSPGNIKQAKEHGPDSLKYRALADSLKLKTDRWTLRNIVSEWIWAFSNIIKNKADGEVSFQSLKKHENDFVSLIEKNDKNLDSLWKKGILLKQFIGEANALKYEKEADNAIDSVTNEIFMDFKDYSVRIAMTGKVIGTNGFIDSSRMLCWPVKSDYFLTEKYEMWAESRIPNLWAWIVSGLFLLFVLTGLIVKIKKG